MNLAERYEQLRTDPARDGGQDPLYIALAGWLCPNATPAEAAQLGALLEPPDLTLIAACAEVQQEGGDT